MNTEKKYEVKIGEEKENKIEMEVEIPWKVVEKHRKSVIEGYSEKVNIAGFRKGRVPENLLIKKVGFINLLSDMAEKTIREIYPQIIEENKIDAIDRPAISITKLAENNPLCFKVAVFVMPKINLPNYKNITAKVNSKEEKIVVEEKDVEETILAIRKQWALHESHERDHEKGSHEHKTEIDEKDLPELNDEFVKKLGKFENVEDFKIKLRESILNEKKLREKDKKRAEIIENILKETSFNVPEIFIESELEKMIAKLKSDVENAKIDFKTYLLKAKTDEEKLRREWKPSAEKRAKVQLILNEIGEKEKLHPTKEEIEHEVKHLLEHYKSADPERAKMHVKSILSNEKVMRFLEEQK
ncbi:MAG: trigger factor [Candidatus Paceibacterota bacterium]